jgi:hypothetical protein
MKTLYFEGAGWAGADTSKATDVTNCRIRTAFTNNDGNKIYLELGSASICNKNIMARYWMHIDHVFYITGGKDDCNESQIKFDWESLKSYDYSISDITKWINKNLNCSFDNILVLPNLAGYRVHDDNRGYNFADEFEYDAELTVTRETIEKHFYDFEKSEGKQYPNFPYGLINQINILCTF